MTSFAGAVDPSLPRNYFTYVYVNVNLVVVTERLNYSSLKMCKHGYRTRSGLRLLSTGDFFCVLAAGRDRALRMRIPSREQPWICRVSAPSGSCVEFIHLPEEPRQIASLLKHAALCIACFTFRRFFRRAWTLFATAFFYAFYFSNAISRSFRHAYSLRSFFILCQTKHPFYPNLLLANFEFTLFVLSFSSNHFLCSSRAVELYLISIHLSVCQTQTWSRLLYVCQYLHCISSHTKLASSNSVPWLITQIGRKSLLTYFSSKLISKSFETRIKTETNRFTYVIEFLMTNRGRKQKKEETKARLLKTIHLVVSIRANPRLLLYLKIVCSHATRPSSQPN